MSEGQLASPPIKRSSAWSMETNDFFGERPVSLALFRKRSKGSWIVSRRTQPFLDATTREAPELIFDGGIGELFVIRVAGNVFSPEVAGSLQYAGAHLHTPLFVVLGHQGCGAVNAALKSRDRGATGRVNFLE